MKTIKEQPENTALINYIIYELNDSELLLNCRIRKNNKFYFSNLPISIHQFSKLIEANNEQPFFLNKIAEELFNKDLLINHVSPFQLFNKDILFDADYLIALSNPVSISA